MKKIAFRNFITLIIISLLFNSVIFATIFSRNSYKNDVENVENELKLLDSMIDPNKDLNEQVKYIASLNIEDGDRVTIINQDGEVLADSEINGPLENHLDRLEVKQAIKYGYGSSIRYSSTTHQRMIYGAILGESGLIIRLSSPTDGIIDYIIALIPGLLISLIPALLLSLFLSGRLARKMAEPLESASKQLSALQDHPLEVLDDFKYEELNTIAQVTNQLNKKINDTVVALKDETVKIHYLLNNMSEGIIMVDKDDNVILINNVALSILESSLKEPNHPLSEYTQNEQILNFVHGDIDNELIEKYNYYFMLKKNDISYENLLGGKVLLFFDMTNQIQSNKMKTAFFANASHELKTPLTSINGYTELLTNDLIKDETIKKQILQKVAVETKRMGRLISDILMISKLESSEVETNLTLLETKVLIEDTFNTLGPIAQDSDITLINESEDFQFYGNLEHLNQILVNLLSNAIKYGKNGGWVKLKILKESDGVHIIVQDNGIGIAQEDLPHITERFYRADKGRSKKIEGTGLGLSIVKHIVQLYNGELDIQSKLGEGTTIIVILKN